MRFGSGKRFPSLLFVVCIIYGFNLHQFLFSGVSFVWSGKMNVWPVHNVSEELCKDIEWDVDNR